jgi:septal ring factor EnvC (AmiA/AmiB activator)
MSMSKRKLGSYAKFVKSHKGAIKAESRKSGKKFLKVAAQMYKASKPMSMRKSKKSMKKSSKKSMRRRASKVSQVAEQRLRTLFSRMPSRMSKVRKSMTKRRKSRASKKTVKKSKARSGSRRATGLALFIKSNKAAVMEYARSHGMTGKKGYVIKAGAALYRSK